MQRAMAKQAEAERERRAKVINAEGEFQASEKLAGAAAILGKEPAAIQLRYLQTLTEVATEKNSTTIFPIPIDLIVPFIENMKKQMALLARGQSSLRAESGVLSSRVAALKESLREPDREPADEAVVGAKRDAVDPARGQRERAIQVDDRAARPAGLRRGGSDMR